MPITRRLLIAAAAAALVAPALAAAPAVAGQSGPDPSATLLVSGLQGTQGSAIGPDRALYVTEGAAGRVTRIDPASGATSVFASGLPPAVIPIGGPVDIAFLGRTAYVLVANVGPEFGGTARSGIYRIDSPTSSTIVADLTAWSTANPPDADIFIAEGVPYALEPWRGGFLVTDGHHNRLLFAKPSATADDIREVEQYGNVVPTGLETFGPFILMTEAGPVPHAPADGKVDLLAPNGRRLTTLASGYSLLLDVEFGPCGLYAISEGDSPGDVDPGSPGLPNTGELLRVNLDRSLSVVVDGLDRPTSVDFRGNTAFIVTVGAVWRVDDVGKTRHGPRGCLDIGRYFR